ncbi:uncharacterized protein ACA1_110260 [Acanthamoeba castellanii str. Neff]|uniref:Uncharacterized protein n=1 Tax=Acanthamoeba castellanii (strain ATCC 30010 / Neff) TaxID=1257118 RepID=L8HHE9_ACACF|nr:uncharacterized protein ACA1_110260 [Acanthamoeba castellanii str. Neff]ELR25014.1 hypothetical protein ACA1_110260 [Acanthamoeba castellanii str. Neff]
MKRVGVCGSAAERFGARGGFVAAGAARSLFSNSRGAISSSSRFYTTTTLAEGGSRTPWIPGNPPTLEQASEGAEWTRETIYQVMYPGHVEVADEIAREVSLRSVVQGLFKKAVREGGLPPRQEERVWSKWHAALERLEHERGVTTLADLAGLNRVAWWRTRVPHALRTALNTYVYHHRLPAAVLPSSSSSSTASSA